MKWTLFDYGVGNIHSLHKALGEVHVTQDPKRLHGADAIVLPGVGALGAVMEALEPAREALEEHHASGRPLMGICIGMQAFYKGSAEAEDVAGLGFVEGHVKRIPSEAGKVPHMGWNTLRAGSSDAIGRSLADAGHVYYVHSYAAPPGPETVATSTYGMEFSAAIRIGNTVGFQFHPEKSSTGGRHILRAAKESLEHTWETA